MPGILETDTLFYGTGYIRANSIPSNFVCDFFVNFPTLREDYMYNNYIYILNDMFPSLYNNGKAFYIMPENKSYFKILRHEQQESISICMK